MSSTPAQRQHRHSHLGSPDPLAPLPDRVDIDSWQVEYPVHKSWYHRISSREFKRRLIHVLPGFLPFILWPIPHKDPLAPLLFSIIVGLFVSLVGFVFLQYRSIARKNERKRLGPILGYACSVFITIFLLPAHLEIGLAVFAILAFGDGLATAAGMILGGPCLPWNHKKTWYGFLVFCVMGTLMAALVYWGESHNPESAQIGVPFGMAMVICGVASIAAAFAESVKSKIDDNIRVGVTAAFMITLMHAWLVGL